MIDSTIFPETPSFRENDQARRLLWEGCYNVRDLGGFAVDGQGETCWQTFVRSDNLVRLSAVGQAQLIAYGVTTIVDLRSAYELDMDASPFAPTSGQAGFPRYLNLPLMDESNSEVMALIDDPSCSLQDFYLIAVDNFQAQIGAIITACAEGISSGMVLFHCHSGRDRTGVVSALLLSLAGVDEQVIADDYALSSVYIQPTFKKKLTKQPEIILAMLAHIAERYGGTEAYLLQCGVSADDVARLRSHLVGR